MGYVKLFREWDVYKVQRNLSKTLFFESESFPPDERFSLTDQIRRSSRSIGAQIAEAWAKRRYPKHFVSKLSDADGEQLETRHWLTEAADIGYLSPEKHPDLTNLCESIGHMLGSMIAKATLSPAPTTL